MKSHRTQIRVVHINFENDRRLTRQYFNHSYVYVGRKRNTNQHFGNPFSHIQLPNTVLVKDRDEACDAFAEWIEGTGFQDVEPERRTWILANLSKLRGNSLGCFCAPKRCHAETLMALANA